MNNDKQIVKKEDHAPAVTKKYIETQKFKSWCYHFFNKKDKDTYGNATQSALRVYNTEDPNVAGVIGHDNLRKLKDLGATFMDKEGFGFADLMKIGAGKMMKESYDVWEKFMIRLGYFEPEKKTNQFNQFNFGGNFAEAIAKSRQERGLET